MCFVFAVFDFFLYPQTNFVGIYKVVYLHTLIDCDSFIFIVRIMSSTELPVQAFLARLSNRPALAALNGLISSFPVIKVFTSNAVPIMVYREQQQKKEDK